ncbi:MAG: M48 family metalloprotease [Burkholderiales bacterium]|nr:M48 family metalloprotease [Bacteroidia bacterium]
MKNIFLLTFMFCLGLCLFSQQNLNLDFKPLKSQGILPEIFSRDMKETVAQEITELNKTEDLDKSLKSTYLTAANYEIEKKVKSGNALINDEVTIYINEIVDIILKDQPDLRKKINVFTLKSSVVNAYCYDKGYLFMDVGLIAHTKNEAQLAYVLCHEITHYVKQHNILGYIHNEKLESSVEGKTEEALLLEKCQYSKEHEGEADVEGFKLLEKTKYDLVQAKDLFEVLQGASLPFELVEFKKSFFETSNFVIPGNYFLKDVAPIRYKGNEDDSERTHPNTSKRKAAVEQLINENNTSGRLTNVIGESKFNYIRDLCRFEVCRLFLKNRDYNAALYSAYILTQKYPVNLFLSQTIAKCLYAISLNRMGYLRYNKDSYLDGPIHYLEVESYPQQMYHLVNSMPDNEWNIMALNYTFRKHKNFPDDHILNAISDSLINLMYYTNCNLETFDDNINIKNVSPFKDSVSYYKNVFADLFSADKEFAAKFPRTVGHEVVAPYTPKSYKINKFTKKMRVVGNISVVMSLDPFYIIFDENGNQSNYIEADIQQQNVVNSIKSCAEKQNFRLVVLDPGLINSTEVNKMNDFSVVNDWLYERMDGRDNEKSRVPVFSADEIKNIIDTYGTSHVLKTGFVVIEGKKKQYVFYSVIYDLKENREVYINQILIDGRPSKSEAESKICSLFNELKNGVAK